MRSAIVYRALSLVAGAAALGLVGNAVRPGGVALASFAPPTECTGGHEAAAARDLAPAEAAGLCGQPGVVIADTRSAAAYAEGHVAGAIHLPCDAAGQVAVEALAHFERAQRIVVYGQSTEEARPVADSLQRRHRAAQVQVLAGGFAAWSDAGLACASGPCDDCKPAPALPLQSRAPAATSPAVASPSPSPNAAQSPTAASPSPNAASPGTP